MRNLISLTIIILCTFITVSAQKNYDIPLKDVDVTGITSDGSSVWVSTYGQGIHQYVIAQNKWIVHSTKTGATDNDLVYCIASSGEYTWAGTADGLYTLRKGQTKWIKRKFASGGEYGQWVRSLTYDYKHNVLWIGRFMNLSRLDVKKQKYDDFDFTRNEDNKTNTFKHIAIEDSAIVWFGTEAGIFKYDMSDALKPEELPLYSTRLGTFKGDGDYITITGMLFDKDYIWFATEEYITEETPKFNTGGLYRFNRRAGWEVFDRTKGLPGNGISAIASVGSIVWFGTYSFDVTAKTRVGKGLMLLNKRTNKIIKTNPYDIELRSDLITALHTIGKTVWIGTPVGVWRVNLETPFAQWKLKKAQTKK